MTYTPKMFTTTQLEIIKRYGRKDISELCLIQQGEYTMKIWCIYEGIINLKEINSANCMQIKESELGEILGHIPHFERILEVLFENDIGVTLWNIHKKSIILEFLNEKDEFYRTRELDYDWTKEPLDQPEATLKELLSLFPNE